MSQLKLTITQIGAWSTKLSVIDLMYKVFRKQKGRKLYFYQPTNHASNFWVVCTLLLSLIVHYFWQYLVYNDQCSISASMNVKKGMREFNISCKLLKKVQKIDSCLLMSNVNTNRLYWLLTQWMLYSIYKQKGAKFFYYILRT